MDSYCPAILVILIITLTECAFASSGDSTIADIVHNSKRKNFNNLTCYQCHSETQADCLDINETSIPDYDNLAFPCDFNSTMCMVKRISYTYVNSSGSSGSPLLAPMKIVSLNRTCAPKCEPGCVIMGERTRLYFCTSCCTATKCNVGNNVTTQHPLSFYQNLFVFLVIFGLPFVLYSNSFYFPPLPI